MGLIWVLCGLFSNVSLEWKNGCGDEKIPFLGYNRTIVHKNFQIVQISTQNMFLVEFR